jgi:hypothetical protein
LVPSNYTTEGTGPLFILQRRRVEWGATHLVAQMVMYSGDEKGRKRKAVGVGVVGNKVDKHVMEDEDADADEEVVVDVSCLKLNNNHQQQQLELQEAVQPTMACRLISDGKIFLLASKQHLNCRKQTGNAQDTRCQ